MTATTSVADETTAPPALGTPQYLGYAAGDAANNLAFSMTSMFLLVYYTDVVGITAAAAGTLFLVIRIWDGFADIFAGRMVDRTMTRWGKFRPFFLFGSVPVMLLAVATFTLPGLEYGEWKTGVRTEGITYALFSFTRKFGQAIGGAAAAFVIGLGGYAGGATTQSQSALDAIRYASGFIPAGFIAIGIAIFFRYPLTEQTFARMVAETAARRAEHAAQGEGWT